MVTMQRAYFKLRSSDPRGVPVFWMWFDKRPDLLRWSDILGVSSNHARQNFGAEAPPETSGDFNLKVHHRDEDNFLGEVLTRALELVKRKELYIHPDGLQHIKAYMAQKRVGDDVPTP